MKHQGALRVHVEEGHAGTAPMDLTLAVQRSEPGFGGTLEYATGVWTRQRPAGSLKICSRSSRTSQTWQAPSAR